MADIFMTTNKWPTLVIFFHPLWNYPGRPAVIPQLAVTITQFTFGWDNSQVLARVFKLELQILVQSPLS